jgi:hypothetical protein
VDGQPVSTRGEHLGGGSEAELCPELLARRKKNGWPQVNALGSHPRGGAGAGIAAAGCSAGVEDRQRHRRWG